MFLNGAISAGHFVSYVDLTPNYAGKGISKKIFDCVFV